MPAQLSRKSKNLDFCNEVTVLGKKKMGKGEFKELVEKITGLKVTDREADFLAKMVDAKKGDVEDMRAS